jgi:hypothetical protein
MSYTCHNYKHVSNFFTLFENIKHLVIYQINVYKNHAYFLIDIYPNKDGR